MPPGPFIKSKSSNANPLRKSTPLRRPPQPANGARSSIPAATTRRGPSVLGAGGTAGKGAATSDSNTEYKDYKLRCCSTEEVKDLRHHIMKFHSRTNIDPAKNFTAPIRLHRKDPRNMQNQLTLQELEDRRKRGLGDQDMDMSIKTEGMNGSDMGSGVQIKSEDEAAEVLTNGENAGDDKGKSAPGDDKGKGPAEEVDLSLIAPDGGARRAKLNPFQKKTRQVILGDETARKLRYEEHFPWVMEDFDGQNTWVGNYEAGQADSFVLFVFDKDGFKMVPAEKYYKMTPRNKYQTLSAEEAEKRMQKGEQPNRWVMKYFPGEGEEGSSKGKAVNMRRRFRTTDNSVQEDDPIRRNEDQEEIDFDEEFADDEEAPIMDGNEEDVKEVEKKVKKELRGDATDALFNETDEEDEKMDKTGLKLIKALRSLEKNGNYESDDEANPYATEESSDEEPETTDAAVKEEDKEKGSDVDATKTTPPVSTSVPGLVGADAAKKEKKKLKKDKLKNKKKKKLHANLPVGMVILQLPSSVLGGFPPNVWNPSLKRRRLEETSEGDAGKGPKPKKIKIKSEPGTDGLPAPTTVGSPSPPPAAASTLPNPASPASAPAASPTSGGSPPAHEPSDADLITEEDVASIIRSRQVTAKQLLTLLKPKLKKHPRNNELLKGLVPRIAKLSDRFLVLKEQQ